MRYETGIRIEVDHVGVSLPIFLDSDDRMFGAFGAVPENVVTGNNSSLAALQKFLCNAFENSFDPLCLLDLVQLLEGVEPLGIGFVDQFRTIVEDKLAIFQRGISFEIFEQV
jgi:hypothetical protein